mmetsp:Transcript_111132/g.166431  ORF Transcript_111132/g.166431 Transcript_111132/m.166431 type:complete len:239 (+) Transcript_111132:120-836(+)
MSPNKDLMVKDIYLHGSHSHKASQLFEDDQLQGRCRGESGPDGHETTPESKGPFLGGNLDHTIDGVVVDLCIGRLVHQSRTDHIEGRNCACHEKSSGDSRAELCLQCRFLPAGRVHNDTLCLIVTSHLGTIQDHGTSDVGVDTTVEPTNALVCHQFLGGTDDGRNFLSRVGHHFCFQNIEGISCQTSKGARSATGGELFVEGRTGFVGTDDNLDGLVKSKPQGSVGCLTKPCSIDSLP